MNNYSFLCVFNTHIAYLMLKFNVYLFLSEYEKDLSTMIEKETGGDLEKLLIEILKVTLVNLMILFETKFSDISSSISSVNAMKKM